MSECKALVTIPVQYANGCAGEATLLGNNAAWMCCCDSRLPLLASGYFRKKAMCGCGKRYVLKTRGDMGQEGKGRTIPCKVEQCE